jgi:tRNA(fMet)-specific endonuclease VapC
VNDAPPTDPLDVSPGVPASDTPSRGILDTSTVILLPRLADATSLPDEPLITAVTLAELSVGPLVAGDPTERAARQAHLQQAEADFDPLPFDADAARAFGRVSASLRRAGRKTTARAYDAMIAAIAVSNDLPVYTCNAKDFSGIDELDVISVPNPEDPPPARSASRLP